MLLRTKITTFFQNQPVMKEKSSKSQSKVQFLNEIVERTLRLPIKGECPGTTATGRLWRAILKMVGAHRPHRRLLHTVLRTSAMAADLMRHTENYITRLPQPAETRTTHSITTDSEEYYRLEVCCRTRQSALLELWMSRCSDVLSVRVAAPRHLWLSVFLTGNYSSLEIYHI